MKLGRVVNGKTFEILELLCDQEIPIKTAYKLKNMVSKLREQQVKYENMRKAGLESYGSRNPDGSLETDVKGNVQFTEDNINKFVKELNTALDTEFDIEPIKVNELGKKVTIRTKDLESLDGLIIE